MNPLIEQLKTSILEEGVQPSKLDELVRLLEYAKRVQEAGKADETDLKAIWWECYQRNEVGKTEMVNGVKMQCNDASEPKETITPGHFRLTQDWDQKYDVGSLLAAGVIEWVPETRTMSAGRKGNVAVTLPKGE